MPHAAGHTKLGLERLALSGDSAEAVEPSELRGGRAVLYGTGRVSVGEEGGFHREVTDNLRRFLAGEPLRNRVDPTHFY